jgi:hypothetical protein
VDEDADDLHPASLPSVTATSTTIADGDAYRYEDFENENDEGESKQWLVVKFSGEAMSLIYSLPMAIWWWS